jgi:glycosyltransferase involved in cell wall biosynthesis
MARRLAGDRHQVTVLTTDARKQTDFWERPDPKEARLPLREVIDGIQVVRLPLAYPMPVPYAFGLRRRAGYWLRRTRLPASAQRSISRWLAKQMPPLPGLSSALARWVPEVDLVHVFDASWDGLFTMAVTASRRNGKPCVATPLMHIGNAGIQNQYLMAHQVDAYRNANTVIVLSQREARALAGSEVPPDRIFVVSMGVEPGVLTSWRPESAEAFRRSQNLTRPVVAFLGANTYDKGAFTLALAVAELASAGLSLDLVYAGPLSDLVKGFLGGQCAAIRSALEGRVHILGTVSEDTKHSLLEVCTLLALPSQVDSFGIVVLEAWLHGKPVIAAESGGIPDVIKPEETGLLVPFGDALALAAGIRRLVAEPDLSTRMGQAGRREVFERYTWDQTYRALARLYQALLPAGE